MKRLLFAFIVFLIVLSLNASCPHCYSGLKVKLVYENGLVDSVYIPYFESYHYQAEKMGVKYENGVDLIDVIRQVDKSIEYTKDFYYSDIGGYLVNSETIKRYSFKDELIKSINYVEFVKGWGGAGGFDTISDSDYKIMSQNELVSSFTNYDSCVDEIYLNYDKDVSPEEFTLLIQYFKMYNVCFGPNLYSQSIERYGEIVSSNLESEYYLTKDGYIVNIEKTLKRFKNHVEKLVNDIKQIDAKHKDLIKIIIESKEKQIEQIDFLIDLYSSDFEKVTDMKGSKMRSELSKFIYNDLREIYSHVYGIDNKEILSKIDFVTLTKAWD